MMGGKDDGRSRTAAICRHVSAMHACSRNVNHDMILHVMSADVGHRRCCLRWRLDML